MPKSIKPLRKRRLRTLNDCVRAGAWLFNGIARDEIDLDRSGKLTYLLNVQKGILQTIENLAIEKQQINNLDERLSQIEKNLGIEN